MAPIVPETHTQEMLVFIEDSGKALILLGGNRTGFKANTSTGQLCGLGQMALLLWPTWALGIHPIIVISKSIRESLRPGGLEQEPEAVGLTSDPSGRWLPSVLL